MFHKIAVFIFFFCFGIGYALNPLKPKIHIYIDYATTPALLQMIDFIHQPVRDKKFIFWRRFPNLHERVNLSDYNAIQIQLPIAENKNNLSWDIMVQNIQMIYDQNPKAEYIIHSNLWWNSLLIPILKIIPREQIHHLYVYEDGLSNVVHSRKYYTFLINPENNDYKTDLMNIFKDQKKYSHHYDLTFHTLYPTTYYFGFVDYMKTNNSFNLFVQFIGDKNIRNIDWTEIARHLTPKQKKALFSLIGFDVNHYKQQIQNKKVDFILLRSSHTAEEEQIKTISTLFKNYDKNRVLVLKEHPHLAHRVIATQIQKNIPNTVIFPKHIPFEVLILADLMPDTVSGYASSVFFSVPPKKIKYYITANKDYYLPFLKKLNMLGDEKIIQSMKEEK